MNVLEMKRREKHNDKRKHIRHEKKTRFEAHFFDFNKMKINLQMKHSRNVCVYRSFFPQLCCIAGLISN